MDFSIKVAETIICVLKNKTDSLPHIILKYQFKIDKRLKCEWKTTTQHTAQNKYRWIYTKWIYTWIKINDCVNKSGRRDKSFLQNV